MAALLNSLFLLVFSCLKFRFCLSIVSYIMIIIIQWCIRIWCHWCVSLDVALMIALTSPLLSAFRPADKEEIRDIIKKSACATCCLDPMPTSFIKQHASVMIPVITNITNESLRSGYVPFDLKEAVIKPLLKKQGLDISNFSNYRPPPSHRSFKNAINVVTPPIVFNNFNLPATHLTAVESPRDRHRVASLLFRDWTAVILRRHGGDGGATAVLVQFGINCQCFAAARLPWPAYVDCRELENSSVWKDRIIVASTCRRSV